MDIRISCSFSIAPLEILGYVQLKFVALRSDDKPLETSAVYIDWAASEYLYGRRFLIVEKLVLVRHGL